MGGFKKQAAQQLFISASDIEGISESEFENSGRGESVESSTKVKTKKISKNKDNKVFSVLLPIELIERLKRYQDSEDARRIETQTYIFTQALNMWLDSKGFEKDAKK